MVQCNDVLTAMTKLTHMALVEILKALHEFPPGTRAIVWIRIPTMTMASRYLTNNGLDRTASLCRVSGCVASCQAMSKGPRCGFTPRTYAEAAGC